MRHEAGRPLPLSDLLQCDLLDRLHFVLNRIYHAVIGDPEIAALDHRR